jgi:hypothetical protein
MRRGFSLNAIADVLGHRRSTSTFVYTKAGVDDLRLLPLEVEEFTR